jgi:hypothetical protein
MKLSCLSMLSPGPDGSKASGKSGTGCHIAHNLPGARRCGNYGCAWRADTLSHRPRPSSCARASGDHPPPARPPLDHGDTATALKTAEPEHRFSATEKHEVQLGPNPARRGELLRN